jgi:hypothetical protein
MKNQNKINNGEGKLLIKIANNQANEESKDE